MNNLKALKRENLTSGSNNKLRADGLIPAILYGGKDPNQNISVSKKEISNIINSDTFLSKVLEIEIEGKKEKVIPVDGNKLIVTPTLIKICNKTKVERVIRVYFLKFEISVWQIAKTLINNENIIIKIIIIAMIPYSSLIDAKT